MRRRASSLSARGLSSAWVSLVRVASDRHLELSDEGRRHAIAVMRKHRLAERLLVDVLGLDWDLVHTEACRWEHVMSDAVERRILALLRKPLVCPHGNPIPGLDDLGLPFASKDPGVPLATLGSAAGSERRIVQVERISEQIQPDEALMRRFMAVGMLPGRSITVSLALRGVEVHIDGRIELFDQLTADHVFVHAEAPVHADPSGLGVLASAATAPAVS